MTPGRLQIIRSYWHRAHMVPAMPADLTSAMARKHIDELLAEVDRLTDRLNRRCTIKLADDWVRPIDTAYYYSADTDTMTDVPANKIRGGQLHNWYSTPEAARAATVGPDMVCRR